MNFKNNVLKIDVDLTECSNYQELAGSWVIWMFISGIILSIKNLEGGIFLMLVSVAIFLLYKKSPKNTSATYFNMALDSIGKNEMNKAKEELNNAIKLNSENRQAYILLSSIYYKEKDYRNTVKTLEDSKVLTTEGSKYNYLVGSCYYMLNKYKEAIKYLNLVRYDDNDPMKHVKNILLGKAYCFNKDYKQAIKLLKREKDTSDELKGDLLEFDYLLGIAYLNLNDKNKAYEHFKIVYDKNKEYNDVEEKMMLVK
nr:CDC27 family protein [Clostridium neonatale]